MAEAAPETDVSEVDAMVQFFRSDVLTGEEAAHFSRSDITPNPKADVLKRLYMRVLHVVYGFRPEWHNRAVPEDIQWPMLYEDAMPVLSVYTLMCKFLPVCHVFDFSLSDLLNPKPEHTITILSAIQNFLLFRKQRLAVMAGHQQSFRAKKDQLEAYTRQIKEAERKIEKLKMIPPDQQAELADLKELNNAAMQIVQEVSSLSTDQVEEIVEMSQKLTQRKLEVATHKEEIAKLSQIVESSVEVRNEMEKMKESIRNLKCSTEQLDKILVDIRFMVRRAQQEGAEIQALQKHLYELQEGMDKTSQQKEEVRRLAALLETLEKELKRLNDEEDQLKEGLAMKLDQESKLKIRRQEKKTLKDERIRNIIRQFDKIHEHRDEVVGFIQRLTVETLRYQADTQSLKDNCSRNTEKAQDMFDRLRNVLDKYHKRLENIVMEGAEEMEKMKANF